MKSYREYSDLNDKQKIIFVKRGIIIGLCVMFTLSLVFGSMYVVIESYNQSLPKEVEKEDNNQTSNTITDTETDKVFLFCIMILVIGALFGLSNLSCYLAYFIIEKLELYTDMNLDHAEKQYKTIKTAIEKQKEDNKNV